MMNGGHLAIGSGATPMLATVLMYLTHWPLQPMDNATAMSVAGLLIAGVGLFSLNRGNSQPTTDTTPKAPAIVPAN